MECPCCGDRLDEKGYCENCGYTVGDELPTPSAGAPVVEENQPTQFVDGEVSYTERKVKKCPTCGAECIEEDKFCSACGHSFDGTKKQPAPTNDFAAATNARLVFSRSSPLSPRWAVTRVF